MFITYKSKRPAVTEGWVGLHLRSPSRWPKVESSKVFILEAVEEVGRAMYGDKWTGDEINVLRWPEQPVAVYKRLADVRLKEARMQKFSYVPRSLSSSGSGLAKRETLEEFEERKARNISMIEEQQDIIPLFVANEQADWEHNNSQLLRLGSVAQWLGQMCRDGEIKALFQMRAGQFLFDLDKSRWNCTDEFSGWLSQGGAKFWWQVGSAPGQMVETYFFLCRESFNMAKGKLSHAPVLIDNADLSKLAPDLRLAVQLAVKHELFDEGNGGLGQGQIVTKILEEAKKAGRGISKTKAEQMAAVMYWTDKTKQKASQSRKI